MRFEPLQPFHVKQIVSQPRQPFKGLLTDADVTALCAGRAEALVLDDATTAPEGRAVACAGILREAGGIGRAWALISRDVPKAAWPLLAGRMRTAIDDELAGGLHRVYAVTALDWPEGHRLLLALGLSLEGIDRGGLPGAIHAARYARVAHDVAPLPVRWLALLQVAEKCLWDDTLRQDMPFAVERNRRAA